MYRYGNQKREHERILDYQDWMTQCNISYILAVLINSTCVSDAPQVGHCMFESHGP